MASYQQQVFHPLVGVVQMTSTVDKQANLDQATSLIHKAKQRGAQMVFLPECFDYVSETQQSAVANSETINGPTVSYYRSLAKTEGLWLSLGGFHEKNPEIDEKRISNTHIIINNMGEIKGVYRKIHLFNLDIKDRIRLQESEFTSPGLVINSPVVTPVGKVGMAICYDLRFPEMSTAMVQQGAQILTYPSAFTIPTGSAHWEVLLRSRAIENQCYVIAAAQVGKHHNKRASYGHAMIVDAWGCVVAECKDKPDVVVAEVDLDYLVKRQEEMPIQSHRDIDSIDNYTFGQCSVKNTSVFYRTALSFAFVNRKPVLPGHILISPLRCVPRFSELTQLEISDMWNMAQKVTKAIEEHYSCTSATLAIQDGPQAGQTVQHVHIHILPRKEGDFAENDDIYQKLESHDKNVKASEWRTDDDMAVEASEMRKYFV